MNGLVCLVCFALLGLDRLRLVLGSLVCWLYWLSLLGLVAFFAFVARSALFCLLCFGLRVTHQKLNQTRCSTFLLWLDLASEGCARFACFGCLFRFGLVNCFALACVSVGLLALLGFLGFSWLACLTYETPSLAVFDFEQL